MNLNVNGRGGSLEAFIPTLTTAPVRNCHLMYEGSTLTISSNPKATPCRQRLTF